MLSIMDVAREKGLARSIGLVLANNGRHAQADAQPGLQVKAYAEDPDFKLVTQETSQQAAEATA
jgi:acetyltransferase